MANIKTVKDLMAAIRETERTTKAYDTTATVTRVAGSTAWVHIPGGVDETPVMKSIDAKAGDEVNVRVSGGKAWITGNNTSPPTNDTEVVQQIYKIANNAQKQAAEADEAALNSISEDIIHYLATTLDSDVTIDTPGWTETPQSIDSTNRYLWTYHSYVLANGNTLDTDPVISGVYGDKGEQGDDGDKGDKGDKGDTGKGISAVQPQYYLSTSPSYLVGGSWSTSLTYSSGYYIWTRDKVTYDDNTVSYSTSIYNQALTEACSLSYNTAQYFWVKESGGTTSVPTGAYVTETPRDTYESNPTLGSLLLRSAGIYIRLAAATIAQFLSSGLTLFSSAGNKLAEFLSSGTILYAGDNNNTEVATFSSNKIELGKNSDSSSIEMCGARASIYTTRLTYGSTTTLQAKNVFDLEDATTQLTEAALQAIHQKGNVWSSASIYCHADAKNSISKVQLFADYVQANGSEVVTEAKASSSAPNMDGTASAGSSTYYARADHVHPTDTSRASSTHNHNSSYPAKITSMPSYTAPTLNASTQFTRSAGGYYRQSGQGVVFVNINIKTKAGVSAVSSNIKVFTGLPAPTFYTTLAAYVGGNSGGCIPCFINDSGELYLRANILNIPADTGVYITGVYISNVFS